MRIIELFVKLELRVETFVCEALPHSSGYRTHLFLDKESLTAAFLAVRKKWGDSGSRGEERELELGEELFH